MRNDSLGLALEFSSLGTNNASGEQKSDALAHMAFGNKLEDYDGRVNC